ncbi:HtaA domain-containing protein [Kitasatospora sp. NPDC090091]|uniref:HtaA domain-containing protein n=1 Tax=Kitasatospora sp. NPDC090091 TaxID=3364081 RepID=UPI00381D411C
MPLPRRFRRLAATLVAALAALLTAALPPAGAVAAEGRVAGGRLDWGIRQSFLAYVTGPVAKGGWSLSGGAATVGGNTFRFHSADGAYDPATGALTAGFSGGVRFTGHRENGADALDLSIARLTFRAAPGGAAGLYADVSSKSRETGLVARTSQAKLADLSLAGVDLRGATGALTLTGVPATLTDAGARAFGGFYPAGTALDPVGLSVNLPAAPPSPRPAGTASGPAAEPAATAPPATSSASPSAAPVPDPTAAPGAPERTAFSAGALDWGVRRTFRDYVTGAVAQGRWELGGGAADGGAFFRWTPAEGRYEPATGALTAAFTGTVRFTGMRTGDAYGLDLTLARPAVEVADGRGRLLADVSGRTPDGSTQQLTRVELAVFDAAGLKPEGALLKAAELPLRLTEAGSRAFCGLYPPGTEMDPLSFAVALGPGAALPPLPDLGSAPPAAPSPTATAVPTATPAAAASSPDGLPAAAVAGAVLAAALAAAGGGVLARRRRLRAAPADRGAAAADPSDATPADPA